MIAPLFVMKIFRTLLDVLRVKDNSHCVSRMLTNPHLDNRVSVTRGLDEAKII